MIKEWSIVDIEWVIVDNYGKSTHSCGKPLKVKNVYRRVFLLN